MGTWPYLTRRECAYIYIYKCVCVNIHINIYIYVNIKNSYIHTNIYIYTLAAPAATFRDDLPRNPKGLIGCECV